LNAHKTAVKAAMYLPESDGRVATRERGERGAVDDGEGRRAGTGEVRFCYEAGPCGYALRRQITDADEAS
jgi:hypothetical protein